jgi:hypothetical protein
MVVKITSKIIVNGVTFYRTEFDERNNNNLAFAAGNLDEFTRALSLDNPRVMQAQRNTSIINPLTASACDNLNSGELIFIKEKFVYNGILYFAETENSTTNTVCAVNNELLDWEPSIQFASFDNPRNLRLNTNVNRIDLTTWQTVDVLEKGRVVHFSSKIFVNGQWYYRTTHNTENNLSFIIPSSATSAI